jgi:starch-binding outer membrane protein, SusD/RagB family
MNNKNNKWFYIITLMVVAVAATSCLNDLNVVPINPQVTQTFNQDEVFAKTYASFGLTGQQGPAGNNDIDITDEGRFSLTRCLWNINELPTDEAICKWGDAEVVELNSNSWPASNLAGEGLYARLYFVVTISNHFLQQTTGMTDEKTVKQRAEVRFLRAVAYYYLMDVFGNVPFAEVISDQLPPQIKRADLFAYIEKELTAIEPDMYDPRTAPYYRVDKAANWLLKARLYLNAQVYTGTARWDDAITYANKVMTSTYILNLSYKQLFMGDNAGVVDGSTNTAPQEIIFPIAADGIKTNGYGGSLFLIASTHVGDGTMPSWGSTAGWEGNRARATLVSKFFPVGNVPTANDLTTAAGDNRALLLSTSRTVAVTKVTDFSKGLSVTKYSNLRFDGLATHDPQFSDMDIPFMRAAEAYLIYAEANLRSTSGTTANALTAINALRTRAHAVVLASITKDKNGLDIVLDEWCREFFFEGRRRMDLIRYGYFGGSSDYNWDWKGGTAAGTQFDKHFNLMPIPPGDLNANSNLVQNQGY